METHDVTDSKSGDDVNINVDLKIDQRGRNKLMLHLFFTLFYLFSKDKIIVSSDTIEKIQIK